MGPWNVIRLRFPWRPRNCQTAQVCMNWHDTASNSQHGYTGWGGAHNEDDDHHHHNPKQTIDNKSTHQCWCCHSVDDDNDYPYCPSYQTFMDLFLCPMIESSWIPSSSKHHPPHVFTLRHYSVRYATGCWWVGYWSFMRHTASVCPTNLTVCPPLNHSHSDPPPISAEEKNAKKLILWPTIYQIKEQLFYFPSKWNFTSAICNPFFSRSTIFCNSI